MAIDTFGYNPDEERAREIDAELARVFVDIEPAKHVEFPPIDSSVFRGAASFVKEANRALTVWLGMPYISDIFGTNHTQRRVWKREFLAKYGEHGRLALKPYLENKFRANTLGGVNLAVENVMEHLHDQLEDGDEWMWEASDAINAVWNVRDLEEIGEAYPRMDLDQRRIIMDGIQKRAIAVLDILSKASEAKRAAA